MIVGVASKTGLIVNDFFDNPGFRVRKTTSGATFSVTLLGSGTGDNKSRPANNPIVIGSPQWYTAGKAKYPPDVPHVGLAVARNTSSDEVFRVVAGTNSQGFAKDRTGGRYIGMNFIAFNCELENENIVIGFVDIETVDRTIDGPEMVGITGQPISDKYEAQLGGGQLTSWNYNNDELCIIFLVTNTEEVSCPELGINGIEGGVRVVFSTAFKA